MNTYQDSMTETELVDSIIELAQRLGWLVVHFRPARTEKGWVTAFQGSAGFPDLLMVRDGKGIAWECKSKSGKTTPEQDAWLDRFCEVSGFITGVIRPEHWYSGAIERVLRSV